MYNQIPGSRGLCDSAIAYQFEVDSGVGLDLGLLPQSKMWGQWHDMRCPTLSRSDKTNEVRPNNKLRIAGRSRHVH